MPPKARKLESGRRRRLGAWGFEGEEFAAPEPMLEWLRRRIEDGSPQPAFSFESFSPTAPKPVPGLGVELSVDLEDRIRHARGQGLTDLLRMRAGKVPCLPDAIVRPESDDDIERVLGRASRESLRVIPWGGGTSVTGGVNIEPDERPAVVLDMERLSGLEDLDEVSGLATLGAGTRGPEVEAALAPHGLTLGHFPQSFELSTLGGWIVTHSSGQESLGYGRICDLVAGADLVAPSDRVRIPALPASATGPDLRHWITGSEGRFGVLIRATVRARPQPEEMRVEAAVCASWAEGIEAARNLTRSSAQLCLLRLSDEAETELAMAVGLAKSRFGSLSRAYLRLRGADRGCLLLMGAKGNLEEVDRAFEQARITLRGSSTSWLGARPGRNWRRDRFRHPYLRDALLDHGYATDTFETAAPWSQVESVYSQVHAALEGLPVLCHLSHPYPDGVSLYFTFFFAAASEVDETIETWSTWKRKAQEALAKSGAATSHHHGVGAWHSPWAPTEWGEGGNRMLATVARELDPEGVLNPHVLLDPRDRLEV